MKSYKGSKKRGILLIAILALSTLSTELFAGKIKRSCNAKYFAEIKSFRFQSDGASKWITFSGKEMTVYLDNKFNAHGGCGKLVPNRCRKRARIALLACARAHAKSPNNMPKECRSNSMGKYPIENLMSEIKERVCRKPMHTESGTLVTSALPWMYSVDLLLGIYIDGKKGCSPGKASIVTSLDGIKYEAIGWQKNYVRMPLKSFRILCP